MISANPFDTKLEVFINEEYVGFVKDKTDIELELPVGEFTVCIKEVSAIVGTRKKRDSKQFNISDSMTKVNIDIVDLSYNIGSGGIGHATKFLIKINFETDLFRVPKTLRNFGKKG